MARKISSGICTAILVLGLLITPSSAVAAEQGEDLFYYLGSGVFTLLHVPFKLLTCGTTQVLTSLAYVGTYGVPGNYEGGTNGKQIGEVGRGACTGAWVIPVDQVKADYQ